MTSKLSEPQRLTETQKELLILFSSDPVTADITPLGTLTRRIALAMKTPSSLALALNNANLGGSHDWKYWLTSRWISVVWPQYKESRRLTFIQVKLKITLTGGTVMHAWITYTIAKIKQQNHAKREMVPVKMETIDGYIYNHACNK